MRHSPGRKTLVAVHSGAVSPSRNALTFSCAALGAVAGLALAYLQDLSPAPAMLSGLVLGGIGGFSWWRAFIVRRVVARHSPAPGAESRLHQVAGSSDPADWILPRIHGFGRNVGSFLPDGFEAYARILHPPFRYTPDGKVEVRWQEIAAANGRTVDEEVMLVGHSGDPSQLDASGQKLWDEQSGSGSFTREIASRLIDTLRDHTQMPDKCWFAVWEGFGGFAEQWPSAPMVAIPHREMLLFEGPITDAALTFDGVDWIFQSANLWWPGDRAWCVATEIDSTWTYVGGSKECIAQILNDPLLEALPVTLTTIR